MGERADHRNAPGDFYVAAGECIICAAPEYEAPDLIRTECDGCYFFRQPKTEAEVERAVRAIEVSCCGAVRYRGRDPVLRDRVARIDADRLSSPEPDTGRRPWWKFWNRRSRDGGGQGIWVVAASLLLAACGTQDPGPVCVQQAIPWTWAEWSDAMVQGKDPGLMPPIPASGWTGRYPTTWLRADGEVADHDADGRIDYVRIVDPPGSYRHHIWVDHDRDGRFDTYPPSLYEGRTDVDLRVPQFEAAPGSAAEGRPR